MWLGVPGSGSLWDSPTQTPVRGATTECGDGAHGQ